MKCPYCGHLEDRVLDTRVGREGDSIRRRRECLKCNGRYTTLENLLQVYPFIIKKDGRREPFSREKVLKGIQAACQKRPVSLSQMEQIVERVAKWVLSRPEREVTAQTVGQKVIKELRLLDDVAYVRFASVYQTFKDVDEFVSALEDDGDELALESEPLAGHGEKPVVKIIEKSAVKAIEKKDGNT
ncbi:MAG: transcriptional regulator NrdR [Bdellovibrionota bacterium]